MNETEEKIRQEMQIVVNSMLTSMSMDGTDYKQLAGAVDKECDSSTEPVVLFLGTVSMKPT